ncbi:TolC family protein [uncultured Gammaproteobacteria bacterium]
MKRAFHANCRRAALLASVSLAMLVSGCASPDPFTREELSAKAVADRLLMFKDQEPLTKPLTLAEAMARVLRDNLDQRSKMMEEALALGQVDLDHFDLLPKLTAGAGYLNRSDHATTTSKDSITLQPALANPSYSMDRDRVVSDLTVSWNILDFGVGWFSARQSTDRSLIAAERRRKAVATLMQNVRSSYWRAMAAQELDERVTKALAEGEKALGDAERVENEQLRNPVESLRFQKTLLENLKQLEAIRQELAMARAELASLINVPPGSKFRLAKPGKADMAAPSWAMPVADMEEAAFVNNPDLREQVYQGRIAVNETRKAILRILPGITFSAGLEHDSNSFLVDKSWTEASSRISWNLFNIVSAPWRIQAAETAEDVAEAKRLALRMAVLAQVHVSLNQFEGAIRQYGRADRLWKIETRLADATASRQENDAQSVIERISNQTSAIAADLKRFQAFAQAQEALGRMQTTIGLDPLPSEVASHDLQTLSTLLEARMDAMNQGRMPPEIVPVKHEDGAIPVSQTEPVAKETHG